MKIVFDFFFRIVFCIFVFHSVFMWFSILYSTVNFKHFFGTFANNDNSFYRENLAVYINCSHRQCRRRCLRHRRRRQYSTFSLLCTLFFFIKLTSSNSGKYPKNPVRNIIFFFNETTKKWLVWKNAHYLVMCWICVKYCCCCVHCRCKTTYMYVNAWHPLYDWFDKAEKMVVWPKIYVYISSWSGWLAGWLSLLL